MAGIVVDELLTKLGFVVDRSNLQRAEQSMNGVRQSMSNVVDQAARVVLAYLSVGKAAETLMSSIKLSAEMESMTMGFQTMLGDLDSAKYLMQQIQQMAVVTPYTTMELSDQVRLMMSFGQSANQALHSIQLVGDVAGANSERMHRLSYALGQVSSATYLKGDDLRQFIEAGFNPLEILARESGKSMMQMRKDMEQAKISAQEVTHAFEVATGPGGKFYKNMEVQSQTLVGLWSTLKDNFQIIMIAFGNSVMKFLKDVVTALIPMVEAIQGAYLQLSEFFGVFFEGGPNAVEVSGAIAAAFMTIADVLMLVISLATGFWSVLQVVFGSVMALVTGVIMVFTAPFAVLMKVVSYVELKIANMLRALGMVGAAKGFMEQSFSADALAEGFMKPARFTGAMAGDSFDAAGRTWDKANALFGMVGGSAENKTPQVALTDKILANLGGKTQVINNNVNNNVTINAEGGFKDLLKEGANSVFSLTFGRDFSARLVAASTN